MKHWNTQSFLWMILIGICSQNGFSFTDPYPKNPNIDAINYRFEFSFSDETDEISGKTTVDVRFLTEGTVALRLDLINKSSKLEGKGMVVVSVKSNGEAMDLTHENDVLLITLPSPSVKDQRSQFTITYQGIPATGLIIGDNKYGDRTFFSDNWPNKGRNWLPTIDHPYDKATCEFIVTAPNHYQVVSNGLLVEETDLADSKRFTHWKQSVPIASWLYVLGVAKFAMQHVDDFNGKAIQTWVYYQDRDAGFYDFAVPTKKALEYYSSYIGPFSYEKLANIQSNSAAGGMEAASAILYAEGSVSGKRNIGWRDVIIHEIAHQWFGNSVTEYDWDDVWLSEGFATYFEFLFIGHEYGRDEFLEALKYGKKRVDGFYLENPNYSVVHDDLKDMSKVTSSNTYYKGAWVLHMLRGVVGTDIFWKGVRSYYKKYKDSNATTADFLREMEEASNMDLATFFDQWLYKPGTLKYEGTWKYDMQKKEVMIALDQIQNDGSFFKMPLEVAFYFEDQEKPQIELFQVDKKSNIFTISVDSEPKSVILDPNVWVLMDANFKKSE
ncbi:MAG: M1 family peptidase [Cytophagales bacterium]|nr:M1 family peptidase [Cytophagales bacterium]